MCAGLDGECGGWKGGRVEGWKGGRVEAWKGEVVGTSYIAGPFFQKLAHESLYYRTQLRVGTKVELIVEACLSF